MATIERAIPVGGAALNFKVMGGTAQPTNPKENTIWVNTDLDVADWAFSTDEPAGPVAGSVWFKTAADGSVAFNALKKNAIKIHLIGTAQRVNGEWTAVDAKIYQNGAWVTFDKFVVFDGNNGISLGTWSKAQSGALTVNANSVRLDADQYNIVAAINDYGVDVTSYKTLTVNVKAFVKAGSQSTHNMVGLSATPTSTSAWEFVASTAVDGVGKYTLDISALTGVHYFKFSNHRYESGGTYLEIDYVEFST